MYLTPTLYTTGNWVLKAPYITDPKAVFTCTSIRSLTQLLEDGVDPFVTYYEPLGLDITVYETDKLNYGSIVTLTSPEFSTIDVPDSHIVSYPDRSSVPYRHVVLSLSLGAISDTVSLVDIKTKIEALVASDLGLTATVREHQSGAVTEYIDLQTHAVIEANRKTKLVNNESLYTKILNLEKANETLLERNRLLEDTIKNSGLV